MPSITRNAHFDGQSIVLDEPFEVDSHLTDIAAYWSGCRYTWSDSRGERTGVYQAETVVCPGFFPNGDDPILDR
jgi:hypothetical protein